MDAQTTPHHTDSEEKDRTRALQLLKAFGYASNSFQALESGYRYWFFEHPEGEVFIPFVPVRGFAVIPGGPVGPQAAIEGALNAFSTFAHKEGRRLLIVGAEPWLNDCLAAQNGAYDFVKLGEQPEWDPSSFSIEGPERKNVRAINRARNKGVIVWRVSVEELERSRGASRLAIEHIPSLAGFEANQISAHG